MKLKVILIFICILFFGNLTWLFGQVNNYPSSGNVSIFDYSPTLILQRNTNTGGFTQGIQTRLMDGTNNWYFGTLHTGQWIVSKGDYQNPKLTVLDNGNIGIGTPGPSNKLEVFSGWNDLKYTRFEAQYLGHQKSVVEINANSGAGDGVQGTGLSINMTNAPYGAGWSRGLYVNVINAVNNYAAVFENGNVGIGTIYPQDKLDICGKFVVNQDGVIDWGGYRSFGRLTWDNGRAIIGGQTNMALALTTNNSEKVRIDLNGNVGIGTNNPKNLLDVKGTIHAQEVKVDMNNWSDFVFHPSYQLKPLTEVEKFIKANGHLHDIPSAAEVEQNGVNVGEMQKKLLQKVEELTLYVIELKKENEAQKCQILEQEKAINEMKINLTH